MGRKKSISFGRMDKGTLALVLILGIFGILMIYDASSAAAFRDFGDKFFYVKNQLLWFLVGISSMVLMSRIDYHWLTRLSAVILGLVTVLLVAVLIPGVGVSVLGARRWLNILGINFQPAELAKLASLLYLARAMRERSRISVLAMLLLLLGTLMMLEPDLGTTIVTVGAGLMLYFVSGAAIREFVLAVPILFALATALIATSAYRRSRILTFLDHQSDPLGASYQVRQILLALGSGGLFGLGLGQSRQKFLFLPEVTTDSIFAVVAEELGFVGAIVLMVLFLLLFARGLKIAREAPDKEGMLLAVGMISFLAIQTVINLAAMVALIPLTGVPLPFVSYGGSSLVVSLSSIGILLNISRQRQE